MRKEAAYICAAVMLSLCLGAHAEDKLRPVMDQVYGAVKSTDEAVGKAFFRVLPTYEASLNRTLKAVDEKFPAVRDFHWAFYIAIFIGVIALLAKLAEISQKYIINTLLGILLLLFLINILGVELRITVLSLIITALFGVPGVIVIVVLHYAGLGLPL